jgi:hypothetical protein
MSNGIFLLRGDELVEMRQQPYDSEGVLQTLLEKYPHLLAGEQADGVRRRWLLVKREAGVPVHEGGAARWSLDHLFVDQDAVPTLVEVKRSDDTRIRREVVGQMLDYAANGVVFWPAERLRSDFESRCVREHREPQEVFNESLGEDVDAEGFWDAVEQNLRSGRVRLVFLADEIPPELRRVIEFLNERMTPTEVIGIEVRQYVGEENLKTLVPRVVGQTEEARIQKVRTPGSVVDVDWEHYEKSLSPDRYALTRELFDRIERAVAERGLPWTPVLRRGHLGFQRPQGYGVVGLDLFRDKPIEFWIKLPLPPDELRALGHRIDDPYPELASHWDSVHKQWEWEIQANLPPPEVGPAIDLTARYQPASGSMPIPKAEGPGLSETPV